MALCYGCKLPEPIVYTNEDTEQPYCYKCLLTLLPLSAELRNLALLTATIPFKPGDRVEARLAGEVLDGVGQVTEVSTSLEHGATPVFPTFKVVIDDPAHEHAPGSAWYTENCLVLVTA
jgi:hypothetical protein